MMSWSSEAWHPEGWKWGEGKASWHWHRSDPRHRSDDAVHWHWKGSKGKHGKDGKGPKGAKGRGWESISKTVFNFTAGGLVTEARLGWGVSGTTFRGIFQTEHGPAPVAIKPAWNWCETEALVRIHSSHPPLPCVVPVLAVEHPTPAGNVNATALASHGTLGSILQSSSGLESTCFLAIIASIADGLANLHSKGIIHCDLKPDNVVLHVTEVGEVCVWLIDFGDARLLDEPSSWHVQGPGAPEIHCRPDNESGQFSSRTDSWCLAQCAALLWNGEQMWPPNPAWLQREMPLSQKLQECLAWNPVARPQAADVAHAARAELQSRGASVKSALERLRETCLTSSCHQVMHDTAGRTEPGVTYQVQ